MNPVTSFVAIVSLLLALAVGGSSAKPQPQAGGGPGRAAALRSVADSASVRAAEMSAAFVLAEYFGYLRRNPTDAPDTSGAGYRFWLQKLDQFGGDFRRAEMVRAFISSIEYRARFGQP
jgi:hypothetical protein